MLEGREEVLREEMLHIEGSDSAVSKDEFCRKHKIDSIIRFLPEEFPFLLKHLKHTHRLTHFNLGSTDHAVEKRYGLMCILDTGFDEDGNQKESGPILTLKGMKYARCVAVKKIIAPSGLEEEDFIDSLPHIQKRTELRDVLEQRYRIHKPGLFLAEPPQITITMLEIENGRR